MSQSEDKKDIKNNEKGKDEQDRLPVGELKWSKEDDLGSNNNEKQEQGNVEEKSTKKDNVHAEISATLLDLEKEEQTTISSHEDKKDKKEKNDDPLAGIEDTLTPIDFKTYEFDAEQLKAIEREMNTLNQQKIDEVETFDPKHNFHHQQDVGNNYEEEEEEYSSDSKWVKRTIWILGVPALLVIVLFVSLIIGHTVVGGQPVSDIFDMGMWMHVYNLIYG
jgi:hypothetical protein